MQRLPGSTLSGHQHRLAIAGVLAYRVFAFWLPIVPGAIAYAGLRRLHRQP